MFRFLRAISLLGLISGIGGVMSTAYSQTGKTDKKSTDKKQADAAQTVVVAEGIGKDEKEALKAAFRDAVGRVVGTLVDAETLVKNDAVISEKILEFSGGFVKTYETIKTEKTGEGLIKIQIKATVEKLQITGRLTDVKVAVRDVRGEDLLAEKMTKDEAKKNATELLAKLYTDLPSLLKAEAKGQPQLTDTRDGVYLDVMISVDEKRYGSFVKKAIGLLDKIAMVKDSTLVFGTSENGAVHYKPPAAPKGGGAKQFSTLPLLGQNTPKGYAIWLLTNIDRTGGQMQWNFYWVDADANESLKSIIGEVKLNVRLNDGDGNAVIEDKSILYNANSQLNANLISRKEDTEKSFPKGHWMGWSYSHREYKVDKEPRETVTLFIAPLITQLDPIRAGAYMLSVPIRRKIKVKDDDLKKFKQVATEIEFLRVEPKSTKSKR
jgi:hypothetical protein